ncbi:unnamed protein product [Caenorhabditis nigoni]
MWVTVLLALFFFESFSTSQVPGCTDGFTLLNGKCLRFFPDKLHQLDAESKCKDFGGNLVTLKNSGDDHAIEKIVNGQTHAIWIGLYCFANDPSQCLWDDTTTVVDSYKNFANGFPLSDIGNCVHYSVGGSLNGKWTSGDCKGQSMSFVCELPATFEDACANNYGGSCYTFHDPLPFSDAQAACEQECGNLVSINSFLENRYLNQLIGGSMGDQLIGASFATPDALRWIDGSDHSFLNLDPSVPVHSHCLMISSGQNREESKGKWYGVGCGNATNFICERPAGLGECNPPAPVTVAPAPANPSNCNQYMLMAPGIITSPNYPNNYGNDVSCTYRINTLGSFNVLLQFTSFSTEYLKDVVSVYDGDIVNRQTFKGNFSGNLDPFNLVSSGNMMTVVFNSDAQNGAKGFKARFSSYAGL